MKKINLILLLAFLLLVPCFTVKAADGDCDKDTTLDFVARDPDGTYIPNVNVDVYKQETDANGLPKPTNNFAGASANNTLGIAKLSWRNAAASDTYAIKVKNVSNDNAAFWYYGLVLGCGEHASLSKTLSGIYFIFHDADGKPLVNASFNVYSQLYNASNQALESQKESVASLNTGVSGKVKVYLPQGSVRSIDKKFSDHYELQMNRGSNKFFHFGISVIDGQLTTMDYYLSSLKVKLNDVTGAAYPASTKVEVFKQTITANNDHKAGDKVGELKNDANGYGSLEVPAGIYVLGIKGTTGQYQYFWDMQVEEGRSVQYEVTTVSDASSNNSTGVCPNNSQFTLVLRDLSGTTASGLKFELYEQKNDTNGLPVAGNRFAGGTIDSAGRAVLNIKPDPRLTYALKIWDKKADLGEFWFYNAVRFVCDYNRTLTKNIPSLEIILRDKSGALKRNYSFSLYSQKYDVDNKPMFETTDLISSLKTDGQGSALVYVSPYNDYHRGSTGVYALSAKDSSGNLINVYDINVSGDNNYTFTYIFSGLSGTLMDASKQAQVNKNISLYEIIGSGDNKTLGRQLLKTKTDASGKFSFEYPAGNYAFVSSDQYNQNNIFWNIAIASKTNTNISLVANLTKLRLEDQQGEVIPNNASLRLYALSVSGSNYYRDKSIATVNLDAAKNASISLAEGPYLAVYSGKNNHEYGVAFYARNNQINSHTIVLNQRYIISASQSFTLSASGQTSASSSSSSSAASSGTSVSTSASNSLKGRILLQVEDKGQAWYINPVNNKRYYLGRPNDAFNLMRKLGLGISNKNFDALQNNPSKSLAGRILIKVEDSGRAYYVNPLNMKLYYLGRPDDAFRIIRSLGLGITNANLNKISVGN